MFSNTEKAFIHFALIYLNEHFDADLLEQFRETHITDELSEQLENKESMDQVEWVSKCLENLQKKVAQTRKTIQVSEKTKETKIEKVLRHYT